MTDKEKAIDITEREYISYVEECIDIFRETTLGNGQVYFCLGVMKGLAEGRKESIEETKQIEAVSDFRWEENQKLKVENEFLKGSLARYSKKIAEQEETIDSQDDKINFYVAKMNEHILKNKELEKENEELKEKLKDLENSDFNSLFDPDELDDPHENEIFEG